MAITLLIILIALGLLHVMPQLARWRRDSLFRRWVTQLADTSGSARVVLALLLPLGLCALAWWLLGHSLLGQLPQVVFALIVLLYCIGPRELETDLEAILDAPDEAAREAAAQSLADDGQAVGWNVPALGEAVAYAALRRRFAVLLWFLLLGPLGALLYRLAQTLAREPALQLDSDSQRDAGYLANALDWLPAQLLTFTLAVVGHWDAVIGAWKRWHSQAAVTSWYSAGPGFLGAAARADVLLDVNDNGNDADPRDELIRLRSTLLRALLAWLSLIALIVIGGWLA